MGLPLSISSAPSDIAQSLFVAHTIASPNLLPSRKQLLAELETSEDDLRRGGYDPDVLGHELVDLTEEGQSRIAYQDEIVDFLQIRNVTNLPLRGKGATKFVDDWRRRIAAVSPMLTIRRAWTRVQALGKEEERKWFKGRRTEEDWADMMDELIRWEESWVE